jgi:hypothetical protein
MVLGALHLLAGVRSLAPSELTDLWTLSCHLRPQHQVPSVGAPGQQVQPPPRASGMVAEAN